MPIVKSNFVEPRWDAPLDVDGCMRIIPDSATVTGMFLEPLVEMARARHQPLPSARDRYVAFRFYPLREHAALLLETCALVYPKLPLRQALRKLGRAAPQALLRSTIGKITVGSASGPAEVLAAMVKAYPLNVRPCRAELLEISHGLAVVRIEELHYFLDSHHIGAFEGVLRFAGASNVKVRICMYTSSDADLMLMWGRASLQQM